MQKQRIGRGKRLLKGEEQIQPQIFQYHSELSCPREKGNQQIQPHHCKTEDHQTGNRDQNHFLRAGSAQQKAGQNKEESGHSSWE